MRSFRKTLCYGLPLFSASAVFLMRNRLKVIWIYARPVSTKMIKL